VTSLRFPLHVCNYCWVVPVKILQHIISLEIKCSRPHHVPLEIRLNRQSAHFCASCRYFLCKQEDGRYHPVVKQQARKKDLLESHPSESVTFPAYSPFSVHFINFQSLSFLFRFLFLSPSCLFMVAMIGSMVTEDLESRRDLILCSFLLYPYRINKGARCSPFIYNWSFTCSKV
jgi:hypothetical protein